MFKAIAVVSLIAALSACASSNGNLQLASASSIGGGISPEAVAINNVQRGVIDVRWSANANGRRYQCGADDMVRRAVCVATR